MSSSNELFYTEFSTSNLDGLLEEMEPKRRLQALKGAFRKTARELRSKAVANLRSSGIKSNRELEKSIWFALYKKKKIGFKVSICTRGIKKNGKGERGIYENKQGLRKPVLLFAEGGSKEERFTKSKKGNRRRADRMRQSHRTGKLRAYRFMQVTQMQNLPTITDVYRNKIIEEFTRVARKYHAE